MASIRAADRPPEQLTAEEREEQRATFYIKAAGLAAAVRANFRMLLAFPLGYARVLAFALRLGPRNLLYLAEAAVFADWMRRQGLTQVHMHFTSTVGLLARRLAPMRTSVTIHGSDEFRDPPGFYLREKVQDFDLVCAISEYGRSQLMRFSDSHGWDKIRVSRLGVDPAVFTPRPFRYNPSPFEIISVGRLVAVKGLPVLIAALERLVAEGRDVLLRLVGDGPVRASLENEVARRGLASHVIFEGRQNADRVRDLYSQADLFALASFAEGIPVVLMEAMAMEIPCVATWITGVPELIRHEADGLLVPPSNHHELAAALARLMDDAGVRLRLGQSARRRVQECYDLNRNTAALGNLLRQLSAGTAAHKC